MKTQLPIILLVLVVAGLVVALVIQQDKAKKARADFLKTSEYLSNQWTKASADFNEQKQVNLGLEATRTALTNELTRVSNSLVATRQTLAQVEMSSKAAEETAREAIAQRDAKIASLESERDELTKRMVELNKSITDLEGKIADTEQKLARAEGDREFLLAELKRLQAEKAELERQFNDLAILREQVRRLKDELAISRRLDWIRRGLYGSDLKGAERLQKGFWQPVAKTNYGLEVELTTEGGVKITSPPTNAPPVKP